MRLLGLFFFCPPRKNIQTAIEVTPRWPANWVRSWSSEEGERVNNTRTWTASSSLEPQWACSSLLFSPKWVGTQTVWRFDRDRRVLWDGFYTCRGLLWVGRGTLSLSLYDLLLFVCWNCPDQIPLSESARCSGNRSKDSHPLRHFALLFTSLFSLSLSPTTPHTHPPCWCVVSQS